MRPWVILSSAGIALVVFGCLFPDVDDLMPGDGGSSNCDSACKQGCVTFTRGPSYSFSDIIGPSAAVDVDGDGYSDLFSFGQTTLFFIHNEHGALGVPVSRSTVAQRTKGFAAGDLDGVPGLDIAVTQSALAAADSGAPNGPDGGLEGGLVDGGSPDGAAPASPGGVSVLRNLGTAQLSIASYAVTPGGPDQVAFADFNGDKRLDIVAGCGGYAGAPAFSVLLANGDGTFSAASPRDTQTGLGVLATGDFDGDGNTDVAVAANNDQSVSFWLGHGDGTFAKVNPVSIPHTADLAAADLNGDGLPDLVLADHYYDGVTVVLNGPKLQFSSPKDYFIGPSKGASCDDPVIVDFDGDGNLDVVVFASDDTVLAILKGDGKGGLSVWQTFPSSAGSVTFGDFDDNGVMDMAVTSYQVVNLFMGTRGTCP